MSDPRNALRPLLVSLLAGAFGCENMIVVDAVIEVPPEVSALFTAERPGRIHLQGRVPKTGLVGGRVGFVCGPASDPLRFHFRHEDFGCAKQATLTAWIEPTRDRVTAEDCARRASAERLFAELSPAAAVAMDQQVIFVNHADTFGCTSEEATVTFRLMPVKPQSP